MKLVAGLVVTSTIELWGCRAQAQTNAKQNKQLLPGDVPVQNFVASNESVLEVIRRLRRQSQVPISLVETLKDNKVSFTVVMAQSKTC